MLEDGLSYPMQGDSWIVQMLIGGVLLTFFFLLIPLLAFNGYLLRVIGTTVRGESQPPAWDDWGELIVDGIKFTIVGLVYSIVPMVVIFGVGGALIGLGGAAGNSSGGLIAGFGLMAFLLLIPVLFLVYYIVPAALANMAVEGSLGAAFDFSLLKNVVLTTDYFIAVLMPIVVGIITFMAFANKKYDVKNIKDLVKRYENGESRKFVFDARPSDAIALAVRVDCPITVSDGVLDRAGRDEDEFEPERIDDFDDER